MRQYIKASHVANEIRMKRSLHKGAFLVVEGDTDARFYKKFVDRSRCKVVVAHDKQNTLKAVLELQKHKFKGVAGIVDADFWHLEGKKPDSPHIFMTDTHDLETMILSSGALETVLVEFAEDAQLKKFKTKTHRDIRELLLEAGAKIGYLRFYALKEKVYLRFNHLDFRKFVNVKKMKLNQKKLVQEVLKHSKKTDVTPEKLERAVQALGGQGYDLWQVCVGHDLVYLLFIGLKNIFGSYNTRELTVGGLEGSLRLAYDPTNFMDTKLFQDLRAWQKRNTGYFILEPAME